MNILYQIVNLKGLLESVPTTKRRPGGGGVNAFKTISSLEAKQVFP